MAWSDSSRTRTWMRAVWLSPSPDAQSLPRGAPERKRSFALRKRLTTYKTSYAGSSGLSIRVQEKQEKDGSVALPHPRRPPPRRTATANTRRTDAGAGTASSNHNCRTLLGMCPGQSRPDLSCWQTVGIFPSYPASGRALTESHVIETIGVIGCRTRSGSID